MARARSEEKRAAILQAAALEIAESGLGASTARIAKGAGVAEGTLFTYFASKDELLNELYVELKGDVYRRIEEEFPAKASLRERARHIWVEYLRWAMERPAERKASMQLHVSDKVTAESRERVSAGLGKVMQTLQEVSERGAFKALPVGFAASAMGALQEAVMETAAKKPKERTRLVEEGFEAFWKMAK